MVTITSVLSDDLVQLLETLKVDDKNSVDSNNFIQTVLDHKCDLEWIENLGQQYRGIRDTLNRDQNLIDCELYVQHKPSNTYEFRKRQYNDRTNSNNYNSKLEEIENPYSPYILESQHFSIEDSTRDKRHLLINVRQPQIVDIDNGLTGVLTPYKSKKNIYKRKSNTVNDAEEQRVMNTEHEKELEKLESESKESEHDLLGIKNYSAKDEILEENKEYLKTSTVISGIPSKNKRHGKRYEMGENVLFPKWKNMPKNDGEHANSRCEDEKCTNSNDGQIQVIDMTLKKNKNNAKPNYINENIIESVKEPDISSHCSENSTESQGTIRPNLFTNNIPDKISKPAVVLIPIILPKITKSPDLTQAKTNIKQYLNKVIQKKEVTTDTNQFPIEAFPSVDIIHSKDYHNFVPEKDIYINTNNFNTNTEDNLLLAASATEKHIPEYGPVHIARIQPGEPAQVFSFHTSTQNSLKNDKITKNEMTDQEKEMAEKEAHNLMEVDKEFNERNEPESDSKSNIEEVKDDEKGITDNNDKKSSNNQDKMFQSRGLKSYNADEAIIEKIYKKSDNNGLTDFFKGRSLKYYLNTNEEEEEVYMPDTQYENRFDYGNRQVKRSNPKDVIKDNFKKLKKIFGFGKNDYEIVTDVYIYDGQHNNILAGIPIHRDNKLQRKYDSRISEHGNHRNRKPQFSHQNRKHFVDNRKKHKADDCEHTTTKTISTTTCTLTTTAPTTTCTPTKTTTPTTTTTTTTTPKTTICTTSSTTTTTTTTTPTTTICIAPSTTTTSSSACQPSTKPPDIKTTKKNSVFNENGDDYLADDEDQEACLHPTTENIELAAGFANKKHEEAEIMKNEDEIEVSSTIPLMTTLNIPTTTNEHSTTTKSETTISTTSEITTPSTVSTTKPEVTAISTETTVLNEVTTFSSTSSNEGSTPNIHETTTTHKIDVSTHVSEKHKIDDKEHENKSKNPVVEDFPQDLTMDEKLHPEKTTHLATNITGETIGNEEQITECTESTENNKRKRKRKKSIHERLPKNANVKKKLFHSRRLPHKHVKRYSNNKHNEDTKSYIKEHKNNMHNSRVSRKYTHLKENHNAINNILKNFVKPHHKQATNTILNKNTDENEDMEENTLRTIPVLPKYVNSEEDDEDKYLKKSATGNKAKVIQERKKIELKRANNKFKPQAKNHAIHMPRPNKYSLNIYRPRMRQRRIPRYNNNHTKIRIRRSNYKSPFKTNLNQYSTSQDKIISQKTSEDDDDLNYFPSEAFERKHFKKPFAAEQLNENINYKEIKNRVVQKKSKRLDGGSSMQFPSSKFNYDANFRPVQKISVENIKRKNRMDENNKGKNEHITNRRGTSDGDSKIDMHLRDGALKGQLAAQIVESIFNDMDNSGQLKKHIGPGLNKDHTKPVTNQEKSDKQDEEEKKQLEQMQENVMKSFSKLIDEEVQRKTCVELDPKSTVFLEKLTNRQNNLAKSDETEINMEATDKPPHQDTFLFEKPHMGPGNKTHNGVSTTPYAQTSPVIPDKQSTHIEFMNENSYSAKPGHDNQNEQHEIEITTLPTLSTHIELNTDVEHSTQNAEGEHTTISSVESQTEHLTQNELKTQEEVNLQSTTLNIPTTQYKLVEDLESTTFNQDSKQENITRNELGIKEELKINSTTLNNPMTQNELTEEMESTTCNEDVEQDVFTPAHIPTFRIETPGKSSILVNTESTKLEQEVFTTEQISTLSIESTMKTLPIVSRDTTKSDVDIKEIEKKKKLVKRLMEMYTKLPINDRHKLCDVYQYLHKQNIFLARVIRQITRNVRYSRQYYDSSPIRNQFNEYSRNLYFPRYHHEYLKPKRQVWSQQYVSRDKQTPSDKYLELLKRAMYYRKKREADERKKKELLVAGN